MVCCSCWTGNCISMDLLTFLNKHRLNIPDKDFDDWRMVGLHNQRACELRGQPHQGTVTPLATNGIYAFVLKWTDQTVIHVMATNVLYIPRLADRGGPGRKKKKKETLAEKEPQNPRRKKSQNIDLLSDFM